VNKLYLSKIFFLSLTLFASKWFFSFYFNLEENFITKVFFDLKDWQYLTLIYNFANLDFNPSYDPLLSNLKYIPIPINSVIFHSIFLKIFNLYGFLIAEFIIIFLFFCIFFKFFKELGIKKFESLILVLFIFCIPSFIDILSLSNFTYVSALYEFFNLRIPRPIVSQIYLFLFLLLLIFKNKNEKFKILELFFLGFLFSSMWGSFFYNIALASTSFTIYYFYITNFDISKITSYLKDAFIVAFFFIIFSIPLILILLNSEPDYLTRVGLINLNFDKKIIILDHISSKIFSLKFLLVFFVITSLYYYLIKKSSYKKEGINLLYIIFLGSFLGPIIFIILSPTTVETYHFMNLLVSVTFFVLVSFIFLFFFNVVQNLSIKKYILITAMFSMVVLYISNNFLVMKNNSQNKLRLDFNTLVNQLNNLNIKKNDSILTFDGFAQTFFILQGYKNLPIVLSVNTSQTDKILENKIINMFKFFNFEEGDFLKFIRNNKSGWRYINNNIGKTFVYKYQANMLKTYKESMDFNAEEKKYIIKSSPFNSQQVIIPKFEIKRLVDKFTKYNNKSSLEPDLVIINLNDEFTRNLKLEKYAIYCRKQINNTYVIFYSKQNNICS